MDTSHVDEAIPARLRQVRVAACFPTACTVVDVVVPVEVTAEITQTVLTLFLSDDAIRQW